MVEPVLLKNTACGYSHEVVPTHPNSRLAYQLTLKRCLAEQAIRNRGAWDKGRRDALHGPLAGR